MVQLERILTVGGGIGGLAATMALRQQGFTPELVERSPEWSTSGTGLAMLANALRMLRVLGLDDAVGQSGALMRQWAYSDDQGTLLSNTDLIALWGDVGPCIGIERGRLQAALLMGVAGVPARLGVSPVRLSQHA